MSDARKLIERILEQERARRGSSFTKQVYSGEPILTTGRQMAAFLPEDYNNMRAISRWQAGEDGKPGRWLTEAELFWRQGHVMADFEDDCPYTGSFRSYFPTYNVMSDRQLRGYFTWRAAVRRGNIDNSSLSYAYVYLYELLNGIGVSDPLEGFRAIRSFWEAFRVFTPDIDRLARVWMRDYVVYHNLDHQLISDDPACIFEQKLTRLAEAQQQAEQVPQTKKRQTSVLSPHTPPHVIENLFDAIDALSTYRLSTSWLFHEHPDALRRVACGVYLRLAARHKNNPEKCYPAGLFGGISKQPYTMFGSAVFFAAQPHPDAFIQLNPWRQYECLSGQWTCRQVTGPKERSARLGAAMRGADRALRQALNAQRPLKEEVLPKYLINAIKREVSACQDWEETHAPQSFTIDLSKLHAIRAAAAETRESLLIDEERENAILSSREAEPAAYTPHSASCSPNSQDAKGHTAHRQNGSALSNSESSVQPCIANDSIPTLSADGKQLLYELLNKDHAANYAPSCATMSLDMLVDTINEAFFDAIGDTVIEITSTGPRLIEDYRNDVEEILSHDAD